MKTLPCVVLMILAAATAADAGLEPFKLTPDWSARIEKIAPGTNGVSQQAKHRALLFSLTTGFKHWVTPHTAEVIKILGRKSGAYEVVESNDVSMFEPDRIKEFDIIILNNNCSEGKERNLFLDATGNAAKAALLEKSLLAHIESGNGLVAIHGSIVMQNNSAEFSRMMGGSFDFHPAQQEVTCLPVDPQHPIVSSFKGNSFKHVDEPYLFNKAYKDKNFRPLLRMDADSLKCGDKTAAVRSDVRYVAWIKKYGKGRVFYCSPSHNAQSFERPELLEFMLAGIRYAAGDLACDDSPMEVQSGARAAGGK